MCRLHQILLIASTVAGSWLAMQAVHESGHILGAFLTGGQVERVVLHPLTISRTDLLSNPDPLLVAWAGPLFGAAAPLLFWGIAAAVRLPEAFLLRFFAGFCLLANGSYIGLGSFDRLGDSGDLLQHGAQLWQLWLFGIGTMPCGLWLWHGQGPRFGFGPAHGQVDRRATYASLIVCVTVLILGWMIGDA